MNRQIDLNCDLGESFGPWRMGDDDAVLEHVSSANIACGFHAGDPATMRRTVQACCARGVAIGAHPSLPDLQGFGRREMRVSADEVYAMVLYQVGALDAFARAQGARLRHVKPHGALYNMAARDPALARAIAQAVRDFDRSLVLFGLSGSELIRAGHETGLAVASEVFADRTYQSDGSLTPRSRSDALIHDVRESIDQVLRMVERGVVRSTDGQDVKVEAHSVCIHGDAPGARAFAQQLRSALLEAGIAVAPPKAA
jgi:UPF0271 protein